MSERADAPETPFRPDEAYALALDVADGLAGFRERFVVPLGSDGTPAAYLCGNSLGLKPRAVDAVVSEELERWGRLAVDGHFAGTAPWYSYHERFRSALGRIVGARPEEVVPMNGLTANLHLMLVSFYRPDGARRCVVMEDCAFPSDTYAVQSQMRLHRVDPHSALLVVRPDEALEELLERRGHEIALLLLGGVNYYTGRVYDMARIAGLARRHGVVVGYDLAHAAGNVELALHDWDVDFAVWCSYKYLNAGPGAVAGCFAHERHARRPDLPRLAGWWGNDPRTRFRMHLESQFVPVAGADGWQLSNPPILALAPLGPALELFDAAGMPALRAKSVALTGYLLRWIDHAAGSRIELLTPREPAARGCQLSLRVPAGSRPLFEALRDAGVVVDHREPDVIRLAPVPLYNSFHDVWRVGRAIARWAAQ